MIADQKQCANMQRYVTMLKVAMPLWVHNCSTTDMNQKYVQIQPK